MVSNMISRAAVLLAACAPIVSAVGNAVIHNQCDFPVYLWSVSNVAGPMQELAANGGEYTEAYENNPDGGGISIKLGRDTTGANITQFEYTLETPSLWYDLSNINGYPFMAYGVSVVPSSSACNQVICPAGIELCADAYNTPDENYATAECSSDADMVVLLCSGAKDTSPDQSASSSLASVASTAISSASAVTVFSSSVATTTKATTLATSTTQNGVVVQTTFTTQVVTVVGSSTTTPAPSSTTSIDYHNSHSWTGKPNFTGIPKERRHLHRHAQRHGAQF